MQTSATMPSARPDSAGIAAGAPGGSHAGVGGPKAGRPSSWFPGSCGTSSSGWGGSSGFASCWPPCCCCSWSSYGSGRRSCSCSCRRTSCSRSSSSFFLCSTMERRLEGQGVRPATREVGASLSIGWASLEVPSPPDPSLMVKGSPSTPDRGGSGAPSCPWGRGALACFGDNGAGSPAMGRGGALSVLVGG